MVSQRSNHLHLAMKYNYLIFLLIIAGCINVSNYFEKALIEETQIILNPLEGENASITRTIQRDLMDLHDDPYVRKAILAYAKNIHESLINSKDREHLIRLAQESIDISICLNTLDIKNHNKKFYIHKKIRHILLSTVKRKKLWNEVKDNLRMAVISSYKKLNKDDSPLKHCPFEIDQEKQSEIDSLREKVNKRNRKWEEELIKKYKTDSPKL